MKDDVENSCINKKIRGKKQLLRCIYYLFMFNLLAQYENNKFDNVNFDKKR